MKKETLLWLVVLGLAAAALATRGALTGMGSAYVVPAPDGAWASADAWEAAAGVAVPSPARTAGVWIAALLTLAIFSFLYRDNPLYKLAEALFIGVSAGYWMVVGFWDVIVPNLLAKLAPAWIQTWALPSATPVTDTYAWTNWIPLLLGLMLIMRLSPRGAWLARTPLAFIIGATAGLKLVAFIQADFMNQIRDTLVPLVVFTAGRFDLRATLENSLLVFGTLACLAYFFFSFEHRGAFGAVTRVGIWFLMITFGAAFGYTVMGRIALLAQRFEFLFNDWLWLLDPIRSRPPVW